MTYMCCLNPSNDISMVFIDANHSALFGEQQPEKSTSGLSPYENGDLIEYPV